MVKPRITLITLGVDDLERAVAFYRDGLGLDTEGIVGTEFEHGAVAFFSLDSGLKLALWPRASLAHDSGRPVGPASATEFAIAHNVPSRDEVDSVMAEARAAGAAIVKPAADTFYGGYAGYFADPDGHLWEIAWNPAWEPPDAQGGAGAKRRAQMTKTATVTVERHLAASPEQIYDAWLDPDQAGRWLFRTADGRLERCEIDARAGGRFRIDERRGEELAEHHGEYVALDRPSRLAFDFWTSFSDERTRITIDIAPEEGGARLTLTHEGVWADYEDRTRHGWGMVLDNLAETLS